MNNLDFWRGGGFNTLRAMERLLDDWGYPRRGELQEGLFSPQCEISESKSFFLVKMDAPGMTKDQLKIDLHDNTLTLSGERREEHKEDDKDRKTHFSEVKYGSFMRIFTLPKPVDAERVEAKYEQGVLSLLIPKSETARTRQITIR